MKPHCKLSRLAALCLASSLVLAASGCGQRGPLYLPSQPADARMPPKQPPEQSPVPTNSSFPPATVK